MQHHKDKIFSIYEDHTDIIVKGKRDVEFEHKVNLATGRSNLILDCRILDGNPADSAIYTDVLNNIHKRGFELFRCEWKTRERFDAKVYWNVIVYNIRVMTGAYLAKMRPQMQ